MTMKEIITALRLLIQVLEWEAATIDDFQRYAQRFGGKPGGNVYEFVLRDALRSKGLTLEQFNGKKEQV